MDIQPVTLAISHAREIHIRQSMPRSRLLSFPLNILSASLRVCS